LAEIVNLRQARKSKARQEKEKTAEANRLKFGRTKAERKLRDAVDKLDAKRHEQNKLDKD
jgi:hypothetical protein